MPKLGNLPLALEQAAAYLEAQQASFADYLASFSLELLNQADPEAGTRHDPVAITWSLNFQEVERISPASADLLRAAAFLAPDAIPDELFLEGGAEISPALAVAVQGRDRLTVAQLTAPLLRFSLLDRNPETRTASVHRLVQEVVKHGLGETRKEMLERLVKALYRAFPAPEFASWSRCERLLAHSFAIENAADDTQELASLLCNLAEYLMIRARYAKAEPFFLRSLAIREKALRAEHPEVAQTLNLLSILYRLTERRAEAETLSLRALAIREKAFGTEHPDVADSLNGLANLYLKDGRFAEAEPLHQRSLAIWEKALGADSPRVAGSLNNLALLFREQGRQTEAEPLFLRALAIREKVLEADHPHLAQSLHNLAILYEKLGHDSEAEPLLLRSLAIREKTLGPDHPDVANSLEILASLYQRLGRASEADDLEARAREVMARHRARNPPSSE